MGHPVSLQTCLRNCKAAQKILLHQLCFIVDTQANKNVPPVFYVSYAHFLLCRASVAKKSYIIKTQEHLDTEVTDSQR